MTCVKKDKRNYMERAAKDTEDTVGQRNLTGLIEKLNDKFHHID
jgi:hypothetical protein